MTSPDFFDMAERRSPDEREADIFARLPDLIGFAKDHARAWAELYAGIEPRDITSREALTQLPVLRKTSIMERQKADPPFGGFAALEHKGYGRVFMSPGPVFEPQPDGVDAWNAARPLYAAGFRAGDLVHNVLAYHMTPGGFIIDLGAVHLGCTLFPAGPGNTESQLAAIKHLQPIGYIGTPDYLKILLEAGEESGSPITCFKKALVSGGALFPSLRDYYRDRGISVLQTYATADLGCIAYESSAMEGMIVNEDFIVEIVRPGTSDPVPEGEVGEVVVTTFKRSHPLIRFATGDLSAILPGESPCGRTNMRIKGWMGRADQRTKVKGMFIDPAQVDVIAKAFPDLKRLRLEVNRQNEQDKTVLKVESTRTGEGVSAKIAEKAKAVINLSVEVEVVKEGSLPNDGKVIDDLRTYD